MTKEFLYDERIPDLETLIKQLESLRYEARLNFTVDEIFRKDWSALVIATHYFKQLQKKGEKKNDKNRKSITNNK